MGAGIPPAGGLKGGSEAGRAPTMLHGFPEEQRLLKIASEK